MEPILVYQRPLPETRTPSLPCKWRAECSVGGKTWVEESRNGASHALARALKESGLPDAPLHIREIRERTGELRPGHLAVPSFYAWAEWTYTGAGERRITWAQAQADAERLKATRPG